MKCPLCGIDESRPNRRFGLLNECPQFPDPVCIWCRLAERAIAPLDPAKQRAIPAESIAVHSRAVQARKLWRNT